MRKAIERTVLWRRPARAHLAAPLPAPTAPLLVAAVARLAVVVVAAHRRVVVVVARFRRLECDERLRKVVRAFDPLFRSIPHLEAHRGDGEANCGHRLATVLPLPLHLLPARVDIVRKATNLHHRLGVRQDRFDGLHCDGVHSLFFKLFRRWGGGRRERARA